MFRVGQKVVCVDAQSWAGRWRDDGPIEGAVYTVTHSYCRIGKACVQLAEIKRCALAQLIHGKDVGYWAIRFRPVVERKTDISFAHEILRKASKKQGADA